VTGNQPTKTQTLTAVIRKEADLYVAECPEVGTASQGATIEEAIANLREATELYLEEFPMTAFEAPLMTHFEVAVHA
jgi:predicted RNase H-like HicB family nuclease